MTTLGSIRVAHPVLIFMFGMANHLEILHRQRLHVATQNFQTTHNHGVAGDQLMKPIKTPKQTKLYYPRLVYCYKSFIESLQEF